MADLSINIDRGRKTAGSKLRQEPGFLKEAQNAVYMPEDPDRLHKIPGRTSAKAVPSGAAAADLKGLAFLKYDNGTDMIVCANQSQLHEATAGATLGAWTSVDDLDGTAYARTGGYCKAIPDGLKRHIVWTGLASERPLIRDEDGNWRAMSLKKPLAPTAALVTATPTAVRANAVVHPTIDTDTCSEGTVTANFTSTPATDTGDGDLDTYAYGSLSAAGILCSDWTFPAGTTSSSRLYVKLGVSSALIDDDGNAVLGDPDAGGGVGGGSEEPVIATMLIQVTENYAAATPTWTTIFNQAIPVTTRTLQHDLTDSVNMDTNMGVRAILTYTSGTILVAPRVYEIWIQAAAAGSSGVATAGTFYYRVTERYSVRLASGRTYVVESAPSDGVSATTNGTTHTGIQLTMPSALANLPADGVLHAAASERYHTFVIYRSTSTGTYPDLGYTGEIAAAASETWMDTFDDPAETTLGAPGMQVAYVGNAVFPLAGQAPSFLDATLYNGSLVAIPKDDPYRIRWTPAGYPDYWPLPHDFAFALRNYSDEGAGITSIGDRLLVFLRTAVLRVVGLPTVADPTFSISNLQIDPLSPSEGLAGTPLAYCHFHGQKGHAVVAWVSDSGIWMTDGTLVSERGLGLVKLTSHKDWRGDVDTSRLDETSLKFDPVLGVLVFDYYDTGGTLRMEYLHISPLHWVRSGEDQMVPKITGPHSLTGTARVIGENGGVIRHWSLDESQLKVYSERLGTQDDSSDITTYIENGWLYPAGPNTECQVYEGLLEHSDWGASEVCDVDVYVRDDKEGIVQHHHASGISLRGERMTGLGDINLAGRAIKVSIRHTGKTVSDGSSQKAFGPLVLETEQGDTVRED